MAEQDIQVGVAYLNGVRGSITITPAGGSNLAANMNIESRNLAHNFTLDEIPSQDGSRIEAAIASKESRDQRIRFMPKAASKAAAATAVGSIVTAMTALKVVTVASSTVTPYNGTFNYIGGLTVDETRDGKVVMEFNSRQYKNDAGSFEALAAVS